MKIFENLYKINISIFLCCILQGCWKKELTIKNEESNANKAEQKIGNNLKLGKHFIEVNNAKIEGMNLVYNFKESDKIASIGAGFGFNEMEYSYIKPNLTFHLQDINPNYLNKKNLEKVKLATEKAYKAQIADSFFIYIGDSLHTNLLNNYYDKIIIENCLHEMKYVNIMLLDIKSKLKSDGLLYISEYCPRITGKYIECGYFQWTNDELINLVSKQGLIL